MNNFLVSCVILIVSTHNGIAFNVENEDGECGQEFMRIYNEAQRCSFGYGYNVYKIDETLAKLATGQISMYQVRRFIRNTCRSAKNDTECIRKIRPSALCENSIQVKILLNINTMIETQLEYLCGYAPRAKKTRFIHLISGDGAYCVATNKALKFCMKTATDQIGLFHTHEILKSDMCMLIRTHSECAYLYDLCTNKKVKEYMTDILDILSEKYNCSPDV